MKAEVWKDVPGYPGVRASTWGRVWFPDRKTTMPNGGTRTYRTAPTQGQLARRKDGKPMRLIVMMRAYGTLKVARLVCLAFHGEPPFERAYCLHISENPLDNRPRNLKWGTQKENLNAPGFIKYCRSRTGENHPRAKAKKKRGMPQGDRALAVGTLQSSA